MVRARAQRTFPVPGAAVPARAARAVARWRRAGPGPLDRRSRGPGREPHSTALLRAGAIAGMAGPSVFTAAWAAASLRQSGYSPAEVQISGLAAHGARDPWIMQAGFLGLGGCLLAFGPALRHALTTPSLPRDHRAPPGHGGGVARGARGARHDHGNWAERAATDAGPLLIQAAGALVIAAGLLRADHVLLTPGPTSWHEHAHDAVSAVSYPLLIVIPLVLAWRLRGDARWRPMPAVLTAAAAAAAVILAVFGAAGPNSPQAGVLQRAGVTIPLAALVALASRLRRRPPAGGG